MALPTVIAVVDDDREVREALGDLLLVEGLACRAFDRAEAFLAAYAPGTFAALITDVRMPGMSGLELLAHIRSVEPDLPVIVVTSAADAQMRQQALEGGALALLIKPIRNAELLSHLTPLFD